MQRLDVLHLVDEISTLKEDMKDNIKEIKETINRLEDNTNKSLKEFGEQTNKSIDKLSDVVQEFKLLVTKEYADKTEMTQCIQKVENKIDKHIEDHKNITWKLVGLGITASGVMWGAIEAIMAVISYSSK